MKNTVNINEKTLRDPFLIIHTAEQPKTLPLFLHQLIEAKRKEMLQVATAAVKCHTALPINGCTSSLGSIFLPQYSTIHTEKPDPNTIHKQNICFKSVIPHPLKKHVSPSPEKNLCKHKCHRRDLWWWKIGRWTFFFMNHNHWATSSTHSLDF